MGWAEWSCNDSCGEYESNTIKRYGSMNIHNSIFIVINYARWCMCVKEHLFNCNCDCKYILLLIRKSNSNVCKDRLNNGKHTKSLCIISEQKIDYMPLESFAVCPGIILIPAVLPKRKWSRIIWSHCCLKVHVPISPSEPADRISWNAIC